MTSYVVGPVARAALLIALFGTATASWADVGVNKGFNPISVSAGQTSTLTVTLINTNVGSATGTSLTDNLPANVVVASPTNASTTCTPGTVSATSGATSASLSGATIPGSTGTPGTCTFSFDVVSAVAGTYVNTLPVGAVTSSQGSNTQAAQATLTVVALAPVAASKAFLPTNVHGNSTASLATPSTLTITLPNSNGVPLTNVAITDVLPAQLAIAPTPNLATTCSLGTASSTATSVGLNGATIPANGSCTLSVSVIAADPNTPFNANATNSVAAGALTSTQGVTNAAFSNTIRVQTAASITKGFAPSPITSGGTSTLTITVNNFNSSVLPIDLTDPLPVGMTINGPITSTCGGDSSTSTATTIVLTGGSLNGVAANAGVTNTSCTIKTTVTATNLTTNAITLTNNIPAATFSNGVKYVAASGALVVNPVSPITGSKSFAGGNVQTGVLTMTITLNNTTAAAATITAFTDNLTTMGASPNFTVAAAPPASTTCVGGAVTAVAGTTLITMSSGIIPANGSCTIVVPVQVGPTAATGNRTNTIAANAVKTSIGNNVLPITGTVNIGAALAVSKAFAPATVFAGQNTVLTITLTRAANASSLNNITFTDTLPALHVIASTPGASTTCLGGTVTAVAGTNTVTLSGGTLAGGAAATSCTVSVNITTPSGSAGTATNTIPIGAVTTTETVSNIAAASANITRVTNFLSLSKGFSPNTVALGGTSLMSVQILNTNPGAINLTNVSLTDNLPVGMQLSAAPGATFTGPGCALGAGTITAVPNSTVLSVNGAATVNANASCLLKANVVATAAGNLINSIPIGAVTSNQGISNISSVSATLAATGTADLGITKTDGVAQATPGGSVTYTMVASNAGPNDVAGATVTDNPPPGMSFISWTCTPSAGSACGTASGSGPISTLVSLLKTGTATFTVNAVIASSATGSISNTATITAPGTVVDNAQGNNTATDTDTLVPQADLAITKTDGVTTATAGGSVTYTITASNAGPSDAPGATVTDTLPGTITSDTWTCIGAGGGTCAASGAGNINGTVNLPAGSSVTYTVIANISAGASGSLSNTATVTAPAGVTDPTPGNNSATDTDTIAQSADLSITKTDGVTTATAGGSVTYTITASNIGPSNAIGAVVADTFPATITSDAWTCVGSGGGTCAGSGSGNINATVNLPVGGSVTYTVVANISASATGSLTNTATVAAPAGVTDSNPGNNSATDTDTLNASADLSITKTDGVTTATAGGSVTYTITAANAGPSAVIGATVADTFPAAISSDTWTCVGAGGGTCTASGSGNINGTVNLPVGASVTYTVIANISGSATGSLSNTATVTTPSGVTDPTPGNNSATDTDTISASADLSITKTDGVTTATPGGSVTYTITASNSGPSDATGATVADNLPSAITSDTWTCVGASGGTCTASGSGNINDTVNLPSGASVTYTVTANISAGATGSLSNTATVTAPAGVTDPTPGNNSATDTDTLTAMANLAITKSDGSTTYTPGSTAVYTVVVTNSGSSNAASVQVSDTLPAGVTMAGTPTCVTNGTASCGVITGVVGSGNFTVTGAAINAGAANSISYSLPVQFDSSMTSASITNTVTTSSPSDPGGPHTASDTDTLAAQTSLAVTKTDGSSFYTPGGSATYTVTVTNSGPSDANTVSVSDTLPAGVTVAGTVGCTANGIADCGSVSGTANSFNATAAIIGAGAGNSLVFTVPVNFAANLLTDPLVNTVSVSDPNDPSAPETASDSDARSASSGLSIAKTDDQGGTYTPGGSANYTVTILNAGPSDANAVAVTDALPAGVTLTATPTCATTGTATCGTVTGAAGGTSFSVSAATLAAGPGNSLVYTLPVKFAANLTTDPLSNTATVNDPSDPTTHTSTDTDTRKAVTALTITKDDGSLTYTPGGTATYVVQVGNTGLSDSSGVSVTDNLPSGVTLTGVPTCVATGNATCGAISGSSGSSNFSATGASVGAGAGNNLAYSVSVAFSPALNANPLVNSVSVSDSTGAPPVSASDSDTLRATTGLTITKDDGSAIYTPGGTSTYTMTLTNAGPSNASGVTVSDPLPSGATLAAVPTCSATGTASCGTLSGVAGGSNFGATNVSVAAGAANAVTFTIVVDFASDLTADPLANTVSATNPSTSTTVTATDSDTRSPQTSLTVTKDDGQSTYTAGGTGTYVVTVANGGPSDSSGVSVSDTLPTGVSLTGAPTCTANGNAVCGTLAGSTGGNTFSASGASVAAGAGNSLVYSLPVAFASNLSTSPLVNTVTVSDFTGAPPVSASDSDTRTATAGFTITKTDGSATYTPGGTATYTIVASNAGPSDANSVILSDPLPAGVTLTGAPTCIPSGSASCGTISGSAGGTSWNVSGAIIAAGASVTYQVPVAFDSTMTSASVANTATVSDTNIPNSAQSATDTDTLAASADLSITKTDGVTTATPGGSVTYTIVASNAGPSAANGATVTDTFPVAITSDSWTCAGAGGGTCTASGAGNINDTVNLPVGASVIYTVTANISAGATGALSNTATVTTAGVTDPTPGNNSATDIDGLGATADVSIQKSATPSVIEGGTITYTLVIGNAGPSSADASTFNDPLPTGVTFVSATCGSESNGAVCGAVSGTGNTVSGSISTLPPTGSVTITITGTAPNGAATLTNTATVATPTGTTDPNPGNNTSTASTTVTQLGSDLSVLKTGPRNATAGSNVTYSIAVTNHGPDTATNVTIADPAPAGLTYVSAPLPCNTGFPCNIGSLTNGQTMTISNVVFSVAPNFSGTIVNTASATSDQPDPTPNNNSSSSTTVVGGGGGGGLVPVPIDARWMLLMMIGLLAGFGVRARVRANR